MISSVFWFSSMLSLLAVIIIFIVASIKTKSFNSERFFLCISLAVILVYEMAQDITSIVQGYEFSMTPLRIYILRAENLFLGAFFMEIWSEVRCKYRRNQK